MTTQAKVGAFVLGCFSILAFTLIYLIDAQFSGHTVPYRTHLRYAGGWSRERRCCLAGST